MNLIFEFIGNNLGYLAVLWVSATLWWMMKPADSTDRNS